MIGPTRRRFLHALGASGALAFMSGARAQSPTKLRLRPVQISRELIARTVVGLRPFRPSGYLIRSEPLGEQTIVHHYGHGGCGVTLSWGTAELAVAEVLRTGAKSIAVLGCGAVGLATARLLQQRGLQATIYARELPPNTLSDVAGARWYPFDFFDSKTASPAFLANVWKVARVAYQAFAQLGPAYGVFYHPTYVFQNNALPPNSLLNLDSPIRDLLPGLRELRREENPTSSPVTRAFQTMMIEPAIYLPAVMRDHAKAGGRIVQREIKSAAELAALKERVIVNCTGLGAATLFSDAEMYPIKGQLTILRPQPEIDYVALAHGLYMFPRRDGIVLGGTFERRVATLEPNRAAEDKILAGHAKFFSELGAYCGRFLDGNQRPGTAEELMRSRYTAYALGRVLYLRESWHPRTRPRELVLESGITWRGLKVVATSTRDAEHAIVEFVARYTQDGGEHALHETSLFELRRGAWVYVAPVDVD